MAVGRLQHSGDGATANGRLQVRSFLGPGIEGLIERRTQELLDVAALETIVGRAARGRDETHHAEGIDQDQVTNLTADGKKGLVVAESDGVIDRPVLRPGLPALLRSR
jgi:hypothetical protein